MNKRHVIDEIKRPGSGRTSSGQRDKSTDTLVARNIPCEIHTLVGRELEIQRQTYAQAQFRIKLFVEPAWMITPKDYLIVSGRELGIGSVGDPRQDGTELELICGEGDAS